MRLTILHFNDLHGRLDQLPRLSTLIQQERARAHAAGRQVLLLEGGDASDSDQWESEATQGRAAHVVYAALGVQAAVIGNKDARWGKAALSKMLASAPHPILSCNLVDFADRTQPAVPNLRPSIIFDFAGYKLGVIGATVPYRKKFPPFGYQAYDPLPAIQREIAVLREAGARTLILLSHLGCYLEQVSYPPYCDEKMAEALPELGVIVGGHTHTQLAPMRVNQTVIVQAGSRGRWLGRLEIDCNEAGVVETYSGALLACTERVPPDPTITAIVELVRDEARELVRSHPS